MMKTEKLYLIIGETMTGTIEAVDKSVMLTAAIHVSCNYAYISFINRRTQVSLNKWFFETALEFILLYNYVATICNVYLIKKTLVLQIS